MEKKRPVEKPEYEAAPAAAGTNDSKIKLLMGANVLMFVWLAFLTYKTFSSAKSVNLDQARLEAKNLNTPDAAANQQPIKPTQPMVPEVDPATATTIAFDESVFDYGKINEGEKVQHVFKFKNTGTKPLTITDAKGSCGCTVPQWSKEPLAPGAEGEMKVEFNSEGKVGSQSKTVTVTANTVPAQTILTIKGEVIKLEGKEDKKPTK